MNNVPVGARGPKHFEFLSGYIHTTFSLLTDFRKIRDFGCEVIIACTYYHMMMVGGEGCQSSKKDASRHKKFHVIGQKLVKNPSREAGFSRFL